MRHRNKVYLANMQLFVHSGGLVSTIRGTHVMLLLLMFYHEHELWKCLDSSETIQAAGVNTHNIKDYNAVRLSGVLY